MVSDILAFLRERLDEDKRIARACRHQTWTRDGSSIHGGHETEPIVDWVYDDGGWEHIARHDPAKTLADIESKQALLDEIVGQDLGVYGEPSIALPPEWVRALRILASAYAWHPDFRPEWKPEQ